MTTDRWGNPLSATDAAGIGGLERAILKFHAYEADPIAALDAVIAEHPDMVMAHAARAGIIATAADQAFDAELQASLGAARALAPRGNARERAYVAATQLWAEGDFAGATEAWGRIAIDHPRDLLAVQLAQLGDFYLGQSLMLRDRITRVLPAWDRQVPGYGFLLGMHAFGLEECGEYAKAEAAGREGVAINPRDGWAVHAVAHVMEMTGRTADGAAWLEQTSPGWAPDNLLAFHNWWHLALFRIEQGDIAGALALFDERISAGGFGQALEMVDGSALLWRLMALGHDVGPRWSLLAKGWGARIAHGHYAFNDLHAMMTFVGLGDRDSQRALLGTLERAAAGGGTNAMMTRDVGLPACRGFEAFGRGDCAAAIAHLLPLRAVAQRFGGSHAQRDVLSWTLVEAALRAGDAHMADALIAERLVAKPESALNQAWAARRRRLPEKAAAAA
ncbi:tetratricopeptide repeat protein [Roseomonas hellenica]|uniref:Tetratricopeptide repeat protein 38 n=1 Tax=Plastoroseomonas hellenica TaxID=2687306 RepID=A0ABS5F327_9PROT|nr:tetratricopeptide repeat protein [Plastoroseomonas hellenica]MBR0666924.1 tetratricopeptide repeat protein [Plastoroseomonas hellenica]